MWKKLYLFGKIFVLVSQQIGINLRLWFTSIVHRLTYRPGPHPKNIVIVGASFAGYSTAQLLAKSIPSGYRIVVIEKHSHFHLTWCLPRFSVVDGHDDKAFIPCNRKFGVNAEACQWVQDTVQSITPDAGKGCGGQVQTASGDLIDYEYLVLATGATAGLPSRVSHDDKKSGMAALQNQRRIIKEAQDIVVVGGGAAGIELAMDTKSAFPDKNVTLIHSRKTLLHEGFGIKIHHAVSDEMKSLGVNLVLGERPILPEKATGEILLSNGGAVHYDLLIKCTGQKPNSGMVNFLSPTAFAPSGHLKVKPSLQVADEAFPRIYAAGDVINAGAIKNARSAREQAVIVAANIGLSIRGKSLQEYRQKWWEGVTKISLGLGKGVIYMTDGSEEITMAMNKEKIEMDSAMLWKYLGAKPFVNDPADD